VTYEVAHVDDLDRFAVAHGLEWRPIRRRFGIAAFGVNAYTAENPGDWIVEEHNEEGLGHEELYIVIRGQARFTLDGKEVDAPAGTLVFVRDPLTTRVAIADEPGTTVLAVGGKPGEAFAPSAWEWYFQAYAEPTEDGIETMESGVRELGELPILLYHLACLEARGGRLDDARSHLSRAIALDPSMADRAARDDDLEEAR
jgi:hypothetical protein